MSRFYSNFFFRDVKIRENKEGDDRHIKTRDRPEVKRDVFVKIRNKFTTKRFTSTETRPEWCVVSTE